MKRWIAVIAFIAAAILASPDRLAGAPSNGTRFPAKGHVELGYEYNNMFARPLARSYGELRTQDHFYTVTYAAADWFTLDGKIGVGDVAQTGGTQLPRLEYDTAFAGGYGFRVRALEIPRYSVRVIAGFQHISVHPQDRSVDNDKYESFLDDWQACCLVAKDLRQWLTLYTGMKGSDCEIVYKRNKQDKRRLYSEEHIGLIVGMEAYLFGRKARAGIEGRFFDEAAVTTSLSYLF